jgi:hypothetical protein
MAQNKHHRRLIRDSRLYWCPECNGETLIPNSKSSLGMTCGDCSDGFDGPLLIVEPIKAKRAMQGERVAA